MKFYDRKNEIEVLKERLTSPHFQLIYLLGRRRIGKTELIQHFVTEILHTDYLYLYVEKMDLSTFLNRQERYFYQKLGIRYHFMGIEDLLEAFFNQEKINLLVVDEFQNFEAVDKSIFSTFQKVVDKYHNKSSKKIVVLGSIQSMMVKIFENANEPLYKRATQPMKIRAFDLDTQIEILQDLFGKHYTHKILLDTYTIFGGVPYYLRALWDKGYTTYALDQLFSDLFFKEFAILQNEGKEILIEEFGQKHRRFFAILEAIATGKNKRVEIVNELEI
ncbi:MAG: ATP-binding protein [Candidatus Peribacteria bacterium]|jgi:AAA+ ATPase superfamily predicted ATPase|nr:ATP-binding protein [Candidatus Peribacteria bacterium]